MSDNQRKYTSAEMIKHLYPKSDAHKLAESFRVAVMVLKRLHTVLSDLPASEHLRKVESFQAQLEYKIGLLEKRSKETD